MAKVTQGRSLWQRGYYAEAVPFYEDGLDKRPKLREAYHELGDCYEKLGREGEAIKTYERALRDADTKDEISLRALGRLYIKKGFADEALLVYVRLQAVVPADKGVAAEIERLEAAKSPAAQAEQARLAKARAKHDEIMLIADRYFKEHKYEDAIAVIESYPEEYRQTEFWVKGLLPLRDKCEAARKK